MILSTEEIKAVLDAAADVARDQNKGRPFVLAALAAAHQSAVDPVNLEKIKHQLDMSSDTGAIIHPHPAVQWIWKLLGR